MAFSDIFIHFLYIHAWILAPILLCYALIQLAFGWYIHIVLWITYILARKLYPATEWTAYQTIVRKCKPANYYKSCCLVNAPTKINKKNMLCYHPHGIFCAGFSWNGAFHDVLGSQKISWLVAPLLFNLPLFNDLISWMGFDSVSKKNMSRLLKKGDSVALLPGGFHEVAILEYDVETVYVPYGFIKLALKYGYTIRPCYTFGETKAYWTKSLPISLQKFLVRNKLPAVLFWGKFMMLPNNNIDMKTIFGEEIKCPEVENPTKKMIEKYRQLYIKSLTTIGDKYGKKIVVVEKL